jgi:hypothetical protein
LRILTLHSRYLSGSVSGENRVVEDETSLFWEAGHQVRLWDPVPEGTTGVRLLRAGVGTIWSRRAVMTVRQLIEGLQPDIVHCHNLFPELSPAVLRTASSYAVPVVMTLHNYRSLCLPATFVRDGRICEDCLGRYPWPGVVHACYRGSTAGSAALAGSLSFHRTVRTFDRATMFVAVGEFVRRKHIEAGWPADRIHVKSNFAWPSKPREGPGEYFLVLGRLSPERAWPARPGSRCRASPRGWRRTTSGGAEGEHVVAGRRIPGRSPGGVGSIVRQIERCWFLRLLRRTARGIPKRMRRASRSSQRPRRTPDVVEDNASGVGARRAPRWAEAADRLLDDAESQPWGRVPGARHPYHPRWVSRVSIGCARARASVGR